MRRRPEGLAQDRPGVPRDEAAACGAVHGRSGGTSAGRLVGARRRARRRAQTLSAQSKPAARAASPAATARCTSAPTRARSRSTTRPPRRWWTSIVAQDRDSALDHAVARSHPLLRPRTRRFEKIEVVDIASRKTIDSFKLSTGNKHMRVNNLQPDPRNKLPDPAVPARRPSWSTAGRSARRRSSSTTWPPHQFTRTIPWPQRRRAREREHALGPDGKHLFFFGDEVTVLETEKFTEVESWPFAAADRGRPRPHQPRAVARLLRSAGHLHRPLHDAGRRCRSAG